MHTGGDVSFFWSWCFFTAHQYRIRNASHRTITIHGLWFRAQYVVDALDRRRYCSKVQAFRVAWVEILLVGGRKSRAK